MNGILSNAFSASIEAIMWSLSFVYTLVMYVEPSL